MRFSTDKELKALPKDKRAYHKDALLWHHNCKSVRIHTLKYAKAKAQ